MAKVEMIKKKEEAVKWEPFVTITLSKREAAGVAAAVAAASCSLVPYSLYSGLNKLLGGTNDYDLSESGESTYNALTESVAKLIDKRFGKLVE